MTRIRLLYLFLSGMFLVSASYAEDIDPRLTEGFESIEAEDVESIITYLAHDLLEGRETGERGMALARAFINAQYRRLGIEPMGDPVSVRNRDFEQRFLMAEVIIGDDTTLTVNNDGIRRSFKQGVDLMVARNTRYGGSVTGSAVFAGYGIRAPELGYNDFEGLDLNGSVVIISEGFPEAENAGFAEIANRYEYALWRRVRQLSSQLAQQGARALLVVSWDPSPFVDAAVQEPYEQDDEITSNGRRLFVPALEGNQQSIPVIWVTPALAAFILDTEQKTLISAIATIDASGKPDSFERKNTDVYIELDIKQKPLAVANNIGYLPGSHPQLKDEYIIIGAHLDHVGVNKNGYVFNGADDNASGSAGVLELAEALSLNNVKPKRSVLFVHWTGEEFGLWGSKYFVEHPTVDLSSVVAYLNMDMIGRDFAEKGYEAAAKRFDIDLNTYPWSEEFAARLVTASSSAQAPELHSWVQALNKRHIHLELFASSQKQMRGGTDYRPFHDRGIPSLGFFTGFHEDYHQSTDTAERINYSKAEKIIQLAYLLLWEVADTDNRLQWRP